MLAELGHPVKMRIVEHLEQGPARQKDLLAALGVKSGAITRLLRELSDAHLIDQHAPGSSHDPYFLVAAERTGELIDAAATLAAELSAVQQDRAATQAAIDKERVVARRRRTGGKS